MAKAETTTKKAASRAGAAKKADASKKGVAKKAVPAPKAAPARKAAAPGKPSRPAKKAAPALKNEVAKQPAKTAKKAEVTKSGAAKKSAAASQRAKREVAKKEVAKKEPAKKEPAKQAAKIAAKTAAAKAAAAKAAPAKAAPAKAAPAKAAPAKAEPVKKAVRKSTVICPLSGFEVKPDKPNLSPRTIDRLRTKLLEERSRHVTQAEALQAEAAQLALDREEGDTQFDEEGGEGDTVSVERERDLMLSASARQIVEEIDRALERIKNKTYGLCTPAGRRISVERLEALPYADTCVDCKARAERRR
jgi:RNA polymerase-binding transcription factor DksA